MWWSGLNLTRILKAFFRVKLNDNTICRGDGSDNLSSMDGLKSQSYSIVRVIVLREYKIENTFFFLSLTRKYTKNIHGRYYCVQLLNVMRDHFNWDTAAMSSCLLLNSPLLEVVRLVPDNCP